MESFLAFLEARGLTHQAPDDIEAATQLCRERGWADGLPVIPPTPERVERMLAFWDRPWDMALRPFPPRNGTTTPILVAANAVMAGCRPEYFPLVMLVIEAMCDAPFNLKGIQSTTHPCAPLAIVNGPVGRELGINGGTNAFGPGADANATIGRAVRLAMLNIGGALPGKGDMATMGAPGKYSFVVAENEQASPWEPLHVERGFAADSTTVTVVGAEGPMNINDHVTKDGAGLLKMVAGAIAHTGSNDVYYRRPQPVLALGPEHAAAIAADGYTKRQVKQSLFENARVPLGRFSADTIEERFRKPEAARYAQAGLDALVPVFKDPDDLIVIVLGGEGKHSMYLPTFGATRSVTRELLLADGTPARSISDFRSGRSVPSNQKRSQP
jgi:hypothetical protein